MIRKLFNSVFNRVIQPVKPIEPVTVNDVVRKHIELQEVPEGFIEPSERLPAPNQKVRVVDIFGEVHVSSYYFITTSDGDYYWDNKVDMILQNYEVIGWQPYG